MTRRVRLVYDWIGGRKWRWIVEAASYYGPTWQKEMTRLERFTEKRY